MIELPTWLVVAAVVFAAWLAHKCLIVGRAQAWLRAMNAIELVAHRYATADEAPLDPPEHEVAQTLGFVLPRLIEGYTREQAEQLSQTPR